MTHAKCPQTLNYQKPQSSQRFDQKTSEGQYPRQSEIHKQWEAEMERINAKYNLDCFSAFELDSESNEGEQYISMSMDMKHLFDSTISMIYILRFSVVTSMRYNLDSAIV